MATFDRVHVVVVNAFQWNGGNIDEEMIEAEDLPNFTVNEVYIDRNSVVNAGRSGDPLVLTIVQGYWDNDGGGKIVHTLVAGEYLAEDADELGGYRVMTDFEFQNSLLP